MEGAPNTFESLEKVPDWRELKEKAPAQAKERIEAIAGFEELAPSEQVNALEVLIKELAEEGNHNRFVAEEVAREKERLEEKYRHAKRLQELGISA